MATKKKSKVKPKPKAKKAKKAPGFYVFVPTFESQAKWEDKTTSAELTGPLTATEALKTIDAKVEAGCKRSLIKVFSGRSVKVETKLK